MNQYYYYKTLRRTILAFLDLFNDIQVAKYNKNGEIVDMIDVPIKFAPKQKFFEFVHRHSHEKRLPLMSAEITGIEYDSSRKTGKHEQIKVQETSDDTIEHYLVPSPYNVTFELKIATEYVVEMEQIVSQILPFFDPFVFATFGIPELDEKWNIKIDFNSVSIEQESEIGEDEKRKILWTLDFTAGTYISKPKGSTKTIKEIIQKIYTSPEAWQYRSNTDTESPSGVGHDVAEVYTEAERDDDGKLLISYEIFELENHTITTYTDEYVTITPETRNLVKDQDRTTFVLEFEYGYKPYYTNGPVDYIDSNNILHTLPISGDATIEVYSQTKEYTINTWGGNGIDYFEPTSRSVNYQDTADFRVYFETGYSLGYTGGPVDYTECGSDYCDIYTTQITQDDTIEVYSSEIFSQWISIEQQWVDSEHQWQPEDTEPVAT